MGKEDNAYRIKINIFESGRKSYIPQKKKLGLFWISISRNGSLIYGIGIDYRTEYEAMEAIRKNKEGNHIIKKVEYKNI